MKKIVVILVLFSSLLLVMCRKENGHILVKELTITAPFDMPTIKIPDFEACKKLNIKSFGAHSGDKEANTKAINEAITHANEIGGATVVIPKGEWLTGAIHLKSNVNLYLDKEAVLIFSGTPADYLPAVHTTWEGLECFNYSPLIYAYECSNIAITGQGELKAQMDTWKLWFERTPAHMNSLKYLYKLAANNVPVEERQMANDTSHLRPQFIQFNRCENVLLEGVTITNSPFWAIHPYMSKNVVVKNVDITAIGPNNDGVDAEMVQNMLIENCDFDQGEDAIGIKSGRDKEGWRINMPTKNVVVRNCYLKNGLQLLAVGSELSGGVQNIFIDSCKISPDANVNHLLYIKTNECSGGFVNNIYMSNISCGKVNNGILSVDTDVLYQWKDLVQDCDRKLTPISNIVMQNLHATDVAYISRINAYKEQPVKNVTLNDVTSGMVHNKDFIHENVINFESY